MSTTYTAEEWEKLYPKPLGRNQTHPDGSVTAFGGYTPPEDFLDPDAIAFLDSEVTPEEQAKRDKRNRKLRKRVKKARLAREALKFGVGIEDYSQAEWLHGRFRGRWRFDHSAGRKGEWYGFREPGIWFPDKTRSVNQEVANLAAATLATDPSPGLYKALKRLTLVAAQERALVALSSFPDVATTAEAWDQQPHLLGVGNGVVDLREAVKRDGRPGDFVTRSTGIAYNAEAKCPTIDQFMKDVFMDRDGNEQPELVEYVLTLFGAALFGHTLPQQFWLFIGPGGGGKGTLARLVMFVLGGEEQYSTAPASTLYTEPKWGAPSSDRARVDLIALKGKRLAYISEPKSPFDDLLLFNHSGGDNITARTLFSGVLLTWEPTHTIIFSSNKAPSIKETGVNMRRRLRVVPFVRSFAEAPDTGLQAKLEAEAEGFLALLVKYAKRYHDDPSLLDLQNVPEVVQEASKDFIEANDPLAAFVTEHVNLQKGHKVSTVKAYEAYIAWHRTTNREGEPLSQVKFNEALLSSNMHAIEKKRDSSTESKLTTYFGMSLVRTDRLDYDED